MTWGDLWLFGHVFAAILWLGAGFSLLVLGVLADRARDAEALKSVLAHTNRLSTVYFIPASLAVVVFGVILVIHSDFYGFDQLWIVLGLVGYALTFLTGLLVIKPSGERLGAMLEESRGEMTPPVWLAGRRLIAISRVDYVVLFLVVFDMVVKPTGDDGGTLLFMAAFLVIVGGYFVWRARNLEAVPAAADAA
jgi:uncharacterized membrane protein